VVAEADRGLVRARPEAQAVAQAPRVEPDEELHGAALRARAPVGERHPQLGLVRHRAAVVVLADAGEGPAAAGGRVQVPAALPSQHRPDVAPGELLAQLHERLAHGVAVAVALALHPLAAVALLQLFGEAARV